MVEIFRTLTLTTAHLTADTAAALDTALNPAVIRDQNHWSYWIVGSVWADYGWWIWAESETPDDEFPECLKACLALARSYDCRWIQFDCDTAPIDELPTYDWHSA